MIAVIEPAGEYVIRGFRRKIAAAQERHLLARAVGESVFVRMNPPVRDASPDHPLRRAKGLPRRRSTARHAV